MLVVWGGGGGGALLFEKGEKQGKIKDIEKMILKNRYEIVTHYLLCIILISDIFPSQGPKSRVVDIRA